MTKITISGGRLIDPANHLDQIADLHIDDDKIIGFGAAPNDFLAGQHIDASGMIVCPGLIELSANLREPGQSRKADIKSETHAAAKSGITRLCLPPDTRPVLDTPAVAELIRDKAEQAGYHGVLPLAALTRGLQGQELSSMYSLKQAGCIAVSNARHALSNLLVLHRAMEYAATHDLLLIYHPDEASLNNNGCAHQGEVATFYGLPGIPESAETIAVAQCLELAQNNSCRVHFARLSCARSVELLTAAQAQGLPVTADVAAHQLHLTEHDIKPFDSAYHLLPPLRSEQDKQALIDAVAAGAISAICSDHQPHDSDAKLGAFPETEAGLSGLETLLPLTLQLVREKRLGLVQAIAALSTKPAEILGLTDVGIAPGNPADLCIFDPDATWTVNDGNWVSRGRNTPFWGQNMIGKVAYTLQNGLIIYQSQ